MRDSIWVYGFFVGVPVAILYVLCRREMRVSSQMKRPFDSMRRPAGYSLEQEIERRTERCTYYIFGLSVCGALAGFHYLTGGSFFASLLIGIPVPAICLLSLSRSFRPIRDYRIGRLGEQVVGAELDGLLNDDVMIFHDIPCSRGRKKWNVDHVVLAPWGLIVVETKTARYPKKLAAEERIIVLENDQIKFPCGKTDRNALEQVRRNANDFRTDAARWTGGKRIPVVPVLTYPGWKVKMREKSETRLLAPRQIAQLLDLHPPLQRCEWRILRDRLTDLSVIHLNETEDDDEFDLLQDAKHHARPEGRGKKPARQEPEDFSPAPTGI
ncbi:MAG: hypothetical protein CMO55_12290 [Verrucomicrobiales bacterium]|nr:hypothetical protein [Verrucomicrobiales bacterium]